MDTPKTSRDETAAPLDSKKAVQIVPKLVDLLSGLSPEERHRAVSAAMILLGQPRSLSAHREEDGGVADADHPSSDGVLSHKAVVWLKKNSITREKVESHMPPPWRPPTLSAIALSRTTARPAEIVPMPPP